MTIFYIDTEYNDGNLYIGDIFEIACLSSTGKLFHSYINIPTNVSHYVQKLCNLKLSKLKQSPQFSDVIDELISFITREESYEKQTIVMGHGAFLTDFPLLITNCIKHHYDHSVFKGYKFVDSMESFRNSGYVRPGLDSLSSTHRVVHTALEDVKLLQHIVTTHHDIRYKLYTYEDILTHLAVKMPLTIPEVQKEAQKGSYEDLELLLEKNSREKTALNKRQLLKIVNRYYYDLSCIYSVTL